MAKKTKESKTLPIYILNGPNLNLLGEREPEVYGYTTLAQIGKMCEAQAAQYGLATVFRQSNREGDIVDYLQEARTSGSASRPSIALLSPTCTQGGSRFFNGLAPALYGYASQSMSQPSARARAMRARISAAFPQLSIPEHFRWTIST